MLHAQDRLYFGARRAEVKRAITNRWSRSNPVEAGMPGSTQAY